MRAIEWKVAAALTAVLGAAPALAASVPGQGTWETTLQARDLDKDGSTDAFYDSVLDVTWLANANAAGPMSWSDAVSWASDLSFGGFTEWRLPTLVDFGTSGCDYSTTGGTDCGYNVDTVTSELAHLYYVTLGNVAIHAPGTGDAPQAGWGLTNTGGFVKLVPEAYWTGVEYRHPESPLDWSFSMYDGLQTYAPTGTLFYAMALINGDVSPVPEAQTAAMLIAGLLGIATLRRRRPA